VTANTQHLVSPQWLAERISTPNLSVVDASWYLPAMGRDHADEFATRRIPGAVFFDQDRIVDPHSNLPHALPPTEVFAREVGALGISDTDTIVVYDGPGFFSAPRVWWLFRVFGAKNVHLLDGGFDNWEKTGFPVETTAPATSSPTAFNAHLDAARLASLADMKRIVETGERQIADARPRGRFTAEVPEPRADMRSGHMPGAHSLPISSLADGGKLKSVNELQELVETAGIDLSKPIVTTCGSGVTAAGISFALTVLGHADHKLFDGSWVEWSTQDDTAVVTGEP